jgi:ketosteroid isomerase-like protein
MPSTLSGTAGLAVAVLFAYGCGDRPGQTPLSPGPGATDTSATEAEIRRLEQREVDAVLARDSAALGQIWDARFVVHNPESQIVQATANAADRPVMQQARTTFTRDVEQLTVHEDIVISMGSETVVPAGAEPRAGETVHRRYTNIWRRAGGSWRLIARHANVVPGAP